MCLPPISVVNTDSKVTFPARAVAFRQCEERKLLGTGRYAGNVGRGIIDQLYLNWRVICGS